MAYIAGHGHLGGHPQGEGTAAHHLAVLSPLEAPAGLWGRFLIVALDNQIMPLRGAGAAYAVAVNSIKRAFLAVVDDQDGQA